MLVPTQNDRFVPALTNIGTPAEPVPNEPDPNGLDVVAAAFRQENLLASFLSQHEVDNDKLDPEYDFTQGVTGTKYEPYLDRFAGQTFNADQQAALMRQIDMEEEDRTTLHAAGWGGMLAELGAGFLSPENFIPFGGAAIHGLRTGAQTLRFAREFATVGALSAGVSELGLQASQQIRPGTESAFAIGGGAILGGALGAGLGAVVGRQSMAKYAKALEKDINTAKPDLQAANENAMRDFIAGAQSVGAAAVERDTLEDLSVAGRAAGAVAESTAPLNPLLRTLASPSVATRQIGTGLMENPIYLKKNFAGGATAPAVETLVKEYTQGRLSVAMDSMNSIYRDFRKGGGTLTHTQFREEVGRAMRRNDESADPMISKAAGVWRKQVFDPLKERAIEVGLLPEDVSVDTALSYFSRVYNRPKIEANEGAFKEIVRNWLGGEIRKLELKADEIKIGNKIVDADKAREQYNQAFERLSRLESRVEGRQGIRQRKLSDLEGSRQTRLDVMKERAPEGIAKALRGADENSAMIDVVREARKTERSAAKKQAYHERFPVLSLIRDRGGVRVGSKLDSELRAMDVTPKSQPGLFKKESGIGDADNFVKDQEAIFADLPDDGTGTYVDPRAIMEAIRSELAGQPLRTAEQMAADADASGLSEAAERWLESVGLDPNASVKEVREFVRRVTGAERDLEGLDARILRLETELEEFDKATDKLLNEREISKTETASIADEVNQLEEEIASVQEIANASPRVSILVDYATTRRDLFKKKLEERGLRKRVEVLKQMEGEGRANQDMLAELTAKEADLSRLDGEIKGLMGKADKLKPMVPTIRQELPDFVSEADRQSYIEEIANEIFNTITGKNADGDIPRDIVPAKRGPLKERTFNIPDEMIEDFLESDVEAVGRRYARTMAGDVELQAKFGSTRMEEQLKEVRDDYQRLRDAVAADASLSPAQKERRTQSLISSEKRDIRDLKAVRDMLRGTYLVRENSTNYARVAAVANTLNYIRALGGVVLSSAADVARHVMVHGLTNVMRDGLVPLMTNLKAVKMSVDEARMAGAIAERILNTRMATWAEVVDPYSVRSPFERFLENTARGFSKANGMVYWNDFQKSFASMLTQARVLRAAADYAGAKPREKAYLAFLGIDEDMAARIAREFEAHGSVEAGGVRVANSEDWTDEAARRVYRAAINKDVDSTIVTKGVGDVPLFSHTPTGRMLLQFKSFALASHQRAFIRGMQEGPAGVVSGTILATAVGMMIYWLKSLESNRAEDLSDNPGRWIAEGLDRSGMFAVAFEANNTIEKSLGVGAYGALQSLFPGSEQGGKASRYMVRSTAAALTGPTGDFIDTLVKVTQGVTRGDMKESDVNAIRRLAPFATLPGIRSIVEYMVMPEAREAVAQ